jgi:cytoskeletal protein RodZ
MKIVTKTKRWYVTLLVITLLVSSIIFTSCNNQTTTSSSTTSTSTITSPTTSSTMTTTSTTNSTSTNTTTSTTTTTSIPTTTLFVWSPSADCASCHPDVAAALKDTALSGAKHAAVGIKCLDCHNTAALQDAHKDVIGAAPVPKFIYTSALCFKCHVSYSSLINLTKDSNVFKTPDGKTINPHDTHKGQVECYECHKMMTQFNPITYCYACHHAQVLECGTCHPVE